jgi:hypothetical protein
MDMPGELKRVYNITASWVEHLVMLIKINWHSFSSLCSVQDIFQDCDIQTTHHSKQTLVEKGAAILQEEVDNPLGRVGNWKMKEKLGLKGTHFSQYVHLLNVTRLLAHYV